MHGTLLASNLGFAEGPVIMADGAVVFCDGNTGELLRWKDGDAGSTFAITGGSPWGAVLGSDGAVYVTQGGNVPGSGDLSAVCRHPAGQPGRSRRAAVRPRSPDTRWPAPTTWPSGPTAGSGSPTRAPSRTPRVEVPRPGRLFALDSSGGGELLAERPDVYTNGIAFDGAGRMYWAESMAHRSAAGRRPATVFCQLSDGHVPDGMAFAEDGRAVRLHDDLRRGDRPLDATARFSTRSTSASTQPTASSPARRCT